MSTVPHDDDTLIDGPLYAAAKKVYPQAVKGTFRRIKWALLVITLGIYYFLPFVRWYRGPNEPSQAVLVDLVNKRFYFFFIEIWPQEVYYFTGLLILAALTLFLMNAVAGRVWCGYLCPQTVWTDLFVMVERWVEGDRRARINKDAGPWTFQRIREKALKHFLWILLAWWTGGVWVLYFDDAPTLVKQLLNFTAPTDAYIWIGILTFTTYALAGHMREQVCLYMCPWPRIQAALTDESALNVTYRFDRGEPRVSVKKAAALRAKGELAGDCIDCHACVYVCPTGVDIRNGSDMGCIQCGLCIDACDEVMTKINRPTRLIAYDTDQNIKARQEGKPESFRLIRPRTMLYIGLIVLIGGFMMYNLLSRRTEGLSVIHDRNPMFVRLSSGELRNAYTLRLSNKKSTEEKFELFVYGLNNLEVELVGVEEGAGSYKNIIVGPDRTREVRVTVSTNTDLPPAASIPLTFKIVRDGETAIAQDFFKGP